MGEWQDTAYRTARSKNEVPWHEPRFSNRYSDGAWSDEDCWVIGGGPSVKGCDLRKLAGRKVIAVNMGFTVCEPTFVFIGSVMLLQRVYRRGEVPDIKCPVVTHERAVWNLRNAYGCDIVDVPLDEHCRWGESLKDGVPFFTNSGTMAINLADMLGAKRIFLVGFDMTGGEDGKTSNFHKHYPDRMRPSAAHYDKYLRELESVSKFCKAPVFNCSPDSRLQAFPHMKYEETIA